MKRPTSNRPFGFRVPILVVADCLLLCMAWAAVVLGYHASGFGHYQPSFYLRMWPVCPVYVVANCLLRLYHGSVLYPSAPHSPVEELRRLFVSSAVVHIGAIAALAFARQTTEDYSRFVIAVSGVLVAVLAQPFRDLARGAAFSLGFGRIPVVLAGGGKTADAVAAELESNAFIGFKVMARFDDSRLREVVPEAKRMGVRVLVACQDIRALQCQMAEYSRWFTHVECIPTASAFPVLGARTVSIGGFGGMEVVNQGRMRVLRVQKWLMDKILASCAFLAFLPVFAIMPLLVKLTSRGPVFYRQERLGLGGRPIRVWKFRSMYVDADERLERILAESPERRAEWERNFKLARDPRVTPLGRLMRRMSIDELPQLFNVFAGEMALIGPRPIVGREVPYYGESYAMVSSVKPGITGLWQVLGRSDTGYARRVSLDMYYVLNWSPWLDVWILFRTVAAVVSMRGAC